MITDYAKEKIARYLHQMFTEIQFGTGGDSSNPFVNELDAPLNVTTTLYLTNIMSNDTTIDFTYELDGDTQPIQGQTIQEVGIFGNLPDDDEFVNMARTQGAGVVSGDPNFGVAANYTAESIMLIRIPVDSFQVKAGEKYDIVITMEVE